HWHFLAYADYRILDITATNTILRGHKNGFCLEDIGCDENGLQPFYNCTNQGISKGCYDLYDETLACQWIDITDLPNQAGYTPNTAYVVEVNVNPQGFFPEITRTNNIVHVPFTVANTTMYDGPATLSPGGTGVVITAPNPAGGAGGAGAAAPAAPAAPAPPAAA
ncbi:Lysyl oxidase-domain-containing protein, partial [Blyttiomyces helicus]